MKFKIDNLFVIVIALFCSLYIFNKITYNWDFIGYMGVVNSYDENNSKTVHNKTYSILEKTIDVEKYELNVAGYRKVMSKDDKAFAENLSFYKIRPLYTGAIYILNKTVFPLIFSIKLMTILPIFFITLILYFTVKKETKNSLVAFIFLGFVLFSPLISKLATTTPDALSALFLLMLVLSYYYKKNKILQVLLMILLVSTRTDNFLWVFFLMLFDTISAFSIKRLKSNTLILLVLFLIYYGINLYSGNAGLWIVYYNTLVNRLNYPISLSPKFNFHDYILGQKFALIYTVFTLFVTFCIISLAYFNYKKSTSNVCGNNIILATIFSLIGRLVLFPAYNSRYMLILFFVPVFILLLENKHKINKIIHSLPFLSKFDE